ncbi:hypothetical protein JRQ81_008767 [Phrynocephalus forsythii]|uniref:Uncharacterized protein n=1 Tax=Phrynocephalus forsythii TaxID=171643 RepID=A0A9Q1ASL9_9SAUR|nr:hypothetical protein JRQ81_008767 [Phrynocephalus forsythii]
MVVGRLLGSAACGMFPLVTASFLLPVAAGLQCYGCNVLVGSRSVAAGCTSPEVITCSHSHQGFKHRFCIKMESVVLGILLTSGCATSRHCQQQELPGVRIHCCTKDLCNGSPWPALARPATACCFFLASCLILLFLLLL